MIRLDKDTVAKLERLTELNDAVRDLGDGASEELYAKLLELQSELAEEFLPLIEKLAAAGLLTAMVPDPANEHLSLPYDSVAGTVVEVFVNGNIWLASSEPEQATVKEGGKG